MMKQIDNTRKEVTHLRDDSPSILHRSLGKELYCIDLDCVEVSVKNGVIRPEVLVDYKVPTNKPFARNFTINIQEMIANQLFIPFFVVTTFLDDRFQTKVYNVLPINKIAKDLFTSLGFKVDEPKWMSIRTYSKFLHFIRDIPNDEDAQSLLSNQVRSYI